MNEVVVAQVVSTSNGMTTTIYVVHTAKGYILRTMHRSGRCFLAESDPTIFSTAFGGTQCARTRLGRTAVTTFFRKELMECARGKKVA